MTFKTDSILTGDEKQDKHLEIGPDPHGAMCTGTGHSRADVKHDPAAPAHKMKLTPEEQDIMDGKQGDVLAIGGLVMADVWINKHVIVIDLLGQEFLDAVNTGDPIKVNEDGTVEIG